MRRFLVLVALLTLPLSASGQDISKLKGLCKSLLQAETDDERAKVRKDLDAALSKDIELTAAQYKEIEEVFLEGKSYKPAAAGSEGEILLPKDEVGLDSGFFYTIPKAYKPEKPSPLILFMHGGEFEKMGPYAQWRGHLKEIMGWAVKGGIGEDYLIAIPATPEGYAKESWRAIVDATIRKMKERFHVDDNRIYLGGGSMGAFGVWETALFHGDRFAGIIPCSGGYYYEDWLPNCRNLAAFIAHGAKDTNCQPENSRNNNAKLKELGFASNYLEFPKNGHAIPYHEVFKQARAWFKDKPRQPYPKKISWRAPDESFFPTSAKANRCFWIEIGGHEKNATLEAESDGACAIALKTKGIKSLKIFLNDRIVDMEKPVKIVANGTTLHEKKVARSARLLTGGFDDFPDRGMLFAAVVDVTIP